MKIKVIFAITKLFGPYGASKDVKNKSLRMDTKRRWAYSVVWISKRVNFSIWKRPNCNAQAFLQFLQYVLNQYPNKHVVMILDNAKVHHARVLPSFLQEHEEPFTFVFLPPYSPNLNVVERIWGCLEESVISNRFHPTRKELRESIVSFLEYLSQFLEKVLQRIGRVVMSGD